MEFKYRIAQRPEAVLNRFCSLARDKVLVCGNGKKGRFTGMFEGSYFVDGDIALIKVSQKPIFLSWASVDKGLRLLMT